MLLSLVKGVLQVSGGTLLATLLIGGAAAAGGLVGLAISFRNLPDVRVLKGYVPTETSYIYDINGELLARVHGDVNREVVPLAKISPHLKRAILAIEDAYFYKHQGIDPAGVGRPGRVNAQLQPILEVYDDEE
ncbi:MAG: transglycosylase domain-containing protein, partial [Pseudanabaenaceae cyanobacterium]